ncbi:MAG TPA: efflux transporter outer membrane subunit [Burkholderiales bacterium]|nr:efflux transporter outer membrane subunit [Burkholderiales bacterium]
MTRSLVIALVLSLLVGGCMLGPDYERPPIDLPTSYGEPDVGQAQTLASDWWTLYRDPLLDELIATALERNADIRAAIARIEEAEALVREANATFFPLIQGDASASRSRISTVGSTPIAGGASPVRNNFQLTASTAFELDFWGRLRRANEAARALYMASTYGRDVVGLTLAASVAQTYFSLRSLDAQIRVSEEMLKASDESVDIVLKRAAGGLISDLDVFQAEGARAEIAGQIKELHRLRAAFLHQLALLTSRLDLQVAPSDLQALPRAPLPPAGLPSTLLEQRPDVRQAEALLAAANAEIGVARAEQFPSFSLTGSFGQQSRELGDLFTSGARIWSIGLGVVGPILDFGRYAARTEQAEARQRQAAAQYQAAAETAFRETADALSNVRWTAETEEDLALRVDRARRSLRLADIRYRSGYSSYIDVLDAQRTLNTAQLELARNRQSYLNYSVELMRALGGGWRDPLMPASDVQAR